MTMAFPTRKLTAVCEITTGQMQDVVLPPAYEGEAGAIEVSVTLQSGGAAAIISDMKASMYLYDKATDAMTDEVSMSISGSTVTGTMPAAFFSISARMLLCIQLTDTATGRTMTVGTLPLEVKNVRGGNLLSLRAPTPSEVVYVGRAPYLSAGNTWMIWDTSTGKYKDSGVSAVGAGTFFAAPRNLLVNSFFAKPVNQRGKTSYSGAGYGIDMWRTNFSGDKIMIESGGIRNTVNSTENGWHLHQVIEDCGWLAGRPVTAACKVTVPPASDIRLVCSFRNSGDAEIGIISKKLTDGIVLISSATIPADTKKIRFGLYAYGATAGDGVTLEWAALYEGVYTASTLMAYTAEKYGAELMECLRYFHLYATAAERPSKGLDCSPPMRLNDVTQGTVVVDGVTYYYNSAEL